MANPELPPGGFGAAGASHDAPSPPHGTRRSTVATFIVGAAIMLVLAVLGIVAVRRSFRSALSAEAKNELGMINASAVAAYEERGRLCGAANRVPSTFESGTKYIADNRAGNGYPLHDYLVGCDKDPAEVQGWCCLKFEVDVPQAYEYSYDLHENPGSGDVHAEVPKDGAWYAEAVRLDPPRRRSVIDRVVDDEPSDARPTDCQGGGILEKAPGGRAIATPFSTIACVND